MWKPEKPSEEVIFALRMFMLRFNLTPADIFKVMVALDKENGNVDKTK